MAKAHRVMHISEAEAATDFASLLARVRAGGEVIIERDAQARRGASGRTSCAAAIGNSSLGPGTRLDGHTRC
jgi:antitoxin (DNA-binding transcriptional repressor) of toxin-antitoxin stability system